MLLLLICPSSLWPTLVLAYIVLAYIVMAYPPVAASTRSLPGRSKKTKMLSCSRRLQCGPACLKRRRGHHNYVGHNYVAHNCITEAARQARSRYSTGVGHNYIGCVAPGTRQATTILDVAPGTRQALAPHGHSLTWSRSPSRCGRASQRCRP